VTPACAGCCTHRMPRDVAREFTCAACGERAIECVRCACVAVALGSRPLTVCARCGLEEETERDDARARHEGS
jgi:transcription elongation factor Elf1